MKEQIDFITSTLMPRKLPGVKLGLRKKKLKDKLKQDGIKNK
jgi:hypothetical protein